MDEVLAKPLPWFENWIQRTGEPVPNFDVMRSMPDLPPLLEFLDGSLVQSPEQLGNRCHEIRELLGQYFFGSFPATPPALAEARVLAEETRGGVIRRRVALAFDTNPQVTIEVETMVPEAQGLPGELPGGLPIFLTQTTHRVWAGIAVSRGYAACIYHGADEDDQSDRFRQVYPECDWARIPRRAWLAGRALDYMLTLDHVNPEQVCITGHSRNGKQSLIATALDPRIKAVVGSSAGSGGAAPFRFMSETAFEESVEFITNTFPDWFHPRLRFFTGREDRLPIDIHGLLALIAPRACLISTAVNDGCESPFAVERGYLAGREVYRFLDRPDNLRIMWRAGGHETSAQDVHRYFDWFDQAFGRPAAAEFPEELRYTFDWHAWRETAGAKAAEDQPPQANDAQSTRRAVAWMLGQAPPAAVEWGGTYGAEARHDAVLMGRADSPEGVAKLPFHFGDYLRGDLYYPAGAPGPLPVVLWLHPFSYPKGYGGAYMRGGQPYHRLAQQGLAVVAFDQIGFGRRQDEGRDFYRRYPHWSRLGKMVRDVQAAIDFLEGGRGQFEYTRLSRFSAHPPALRLDAIICLGYALGGMVALHAAALDQRIAGVACFAGFTPMRGDTDDSATGGNRRFFDWHGLLPRLGLFQGREDQIPYDYGDLLRLIAPRHGLVVAPTGDREADHEAVTACVDEARDAWAQQRGLGHLTFISAADYSRFQGDQQAMFVQWWQRCVLREGM